MKCQSWWILFVFSCTCSNQLVLGTHEEDSWIDSDAWGREHYRQKSNDITNNLQSRESISDLNSDFKIGSSQNEDPVTLMYYKRLIAYLFNNDLFKYDKVTGEYSRVVIFTALPDQLKQLHSLNDPRDLNTVISDILSKARAPTKHDYYSLYENDSDIIGLGIFGQIWSIIKQCTQLLKVSEVQFLIGAVTVILYGWFCHRRYQIGIIPMIIGGVICFGYFHTYIECNRKLEAERLLEIISDHESKKEVNRWYTPVINFFTSSEQVKKEAKSEFIKKSSKVHLNFCRPDHVFLLYTNDLFLKQLGFLIDKSVETMSMLSDNLRFPFNYLAAVLLVLLIAYIVKLTFKYILSPRAWIGVWQTSRIGSHVPHHDALPTCSGTATTEDRLSGENLRLLLNAISGSATWNQITISNITSKTLLQSQEAASGVEEILMPLENSGSPDAVTESSLSEVTEEKPKQNWPQKQEVKLNNNNGIEKQNDVLHDCEKSNTVKLEDENA